METFSFVDIISSLLTLTVLEIVLGVDNLVFLSIVSQRLPEETRRKGRLIGLSLAWILRLMLLFSAVWLSKLIHPLFYIGSFAVSGRDLFLLAGGLFLLVKATQEIHNEFEEAPEPKLSNRRGLFIAVIIQIAIIDMVFSLDSVITAIGLTQVFWIMTIAITIAIILMLCASEPMSNFISRYPTIKMLALSFLMLVGTLLVADALHFHVPRGYLYFAIGFSAFVEYLNHLRRGRRHRKKQRR